MYAGPPGRGRLRKKEGILGGADGTVEDWYRCVRNLSVSSRENWAHRLIDGTGSYWQSCGQEGKVRTLILSVLIQCQMFFYHSYLHFYKLFSYKLSSHYPL